jgi:hypothetical protein
MRTVIVLGAVLILSSTAFVARGLAGPDRSGPSTTAQDPHDHQHTATARPEATPPEHGGRRQMMGKDNATDDLTQLVARMNAATGEAKTASIAELLTRLVQQQTTMRTTMDESMKAMKSECSMMKKTNTDQQPEH